MDEKPSNTFLGFLVDKIADKVADKVVELLDARLERATQKALMEMHNAGVSSIEEAHHTALLILADNLDELGIENLTAVDEMGSARKLVVVDPRPGKRPAFVEPAKGSSASIATMRFVVYFDGAEYGEQFMTMDDVVQQFERLQTSVHGG